MTEKQTKIFKEVTGVENLWRPEKVDESVEGEVKNIGEGNFGRELSIEKDDVKATLPSLTVLNTKLKGVKVGDYIRVTYLGEVRSKKGNSLYMDFKVEVAE